MNNSYHRTPPHHSPNSHNGRYHWSFWVLSVLLTVALLVHSGCKSSKPTPENKLPAKSSVAAPTATPPAPKAPTAEKTSAGAVQQPPIKTLCQRVYLHVLKLSEAEKVPAEVLEKMRSRQEQAVAECAAETGNMKQGRARIECILRAKHSSAVASCINL